MTGLLYDTSHETMVTCDAWQENIITKIHVAELSFINLPWG